MATWSKLRFDCDGETISLKCLVFADVEGIETSMLPEEFGRQIPADKRDAFMQRVTESLNDEVDYIDEQLAQALHSAVLDTAKDMFEQ